LLQFLTHFGKILQTFTPFYPVGKFAGIGSVQYGSTLAGIVPLAKALGLFDPIKMVGSSEIALASCRPFSFLKQDANYSGHFSLDYRSSL
jgi:hypothetical protein